MYFLGKLFVVSLGASYAVKYLELLSNVPFDTANAPTVALLAIAIPTALNCAKWLARSTGDNDAFEMF